MVCRPTRAANPADGMLKSTEYLFDSYQSSNAVVHALLQHATLLMAGGRLLTLAAALVLARDCVNARC